MDLIYFIAGIAILIFLHELGHFIAARIFHVEVDEFGIGFPPTILKIGTFQGTDFTLNAIPLGGFVRIKGENDPEVPGGLAAANPWVRLAITAAGPLTNIFLGVLLSIILFYRLGEPIPDRVKIIGIAENSPAQLAGLQNGDVIKAVEGVEVKSVEELHDLIYQRLGQPITITFERQGSISSVSLVPRNPPPENEGAIGIMMGYDTRPTVWYKAIPRGMKYTYDSIVMVLSIPKMLIRGQISPEMARPVGYKGMYDIYRQVENPLSFFLMITMSLGIFNLLPIPALDGGRIFFSLSEIVTRRRLPPKFENALHTMGFIILLSILVIVNVMDFVSPLKWPY